MGNRGGVGKVISVKRLAGRTSSPRGQVLRYVLAGGLAFTVDFLLLKICTDFFNIYYLVSSIIGYVSGLAITYTLSIRWVFDRRKVVNKWAEFLVFAAIGGVGMGLTYLFMWLFTGVFGLYYLFSKLITTALITGWNFTARKIILF